MVLSNIITPQGEIVIKNFKYKGGSVSYSYDYLWSPLAEYLLKFTPHWWAPNAITLAGFLINVIGCLSLIVQTQIGGKIQPWTFWFFSICVFTYQTLDNIDGKQARKTGNSSPLGMLFDHGCDAFGLLFLALSVSRIIRLQDEQTILYVGFVGVIFGFYFSVWCQYYSKGIMILGQINAVDDGIPAVWSLSILTYFIGQNIWLTQVTQIWGVKINLSLAFAYVVLFSTILQIWSLLNKSKQNFTKNYLGAISDLIHVLLIIMALISIIECSTLYLRYFYQVYFSLGIMFVRNIIYMQVCVTAQMKYNQFQLSTLLFALGYPLYIFVLSKMGFSQKLFIYGLLIIIVLDFAYFVLKVIFQFRRILNIRVFRVNKDKKLKN